MRTILPILVVILCLSACKSRQRPDSALRDTGIITTVPKDQRASAFCWAYSLIAHLEQRYYEQTRGDAGGGFRLNFSEEYLGLAHLAQQLIDGKPTNEGLRLSESLALVEKYGLVPESMNIVTNGQTAKLEFKPDFDISLTPLIIEAANTYWQEHEQGPETPIDAQAAINLIGGLKTPEHPDGLLSEVQKRFLLAALGKGTASDAQFRFANTVYTPQTFAKNRIKFEPSDYYILTMPDSGRGQDGDRPFDPQYLRAVKMLKKTMLSGYSIPISFNFIRGSKAQDGILRCNEKGCWDADLATPTTSWPHANHAVLLVDYRGAQSSFQPVTAGTLQQSFEAEPFEWVIKNSWGFNANTSTDPNLLRKFPLPAYTVMTQDFYEASHKLAPGRYEAIIPRKLCLRHQTQCQDFIKTSEAGGLPAADQVDLSLNTDAVLASIKNDAAARRDPVSFAKDAKVLAPDNSLVQLMSEELPTSVDGFKQVAVAAETMIEATEETHVYLCGALKVDPSVKYLAVYFAKDAQSSVDPTPRAVLSAQSNWRYCNKTENVASTFMLYMQPLDAAYKALGTMKASIKIVGKAP